MNDVPAHLEPYVSVLGEQSEAFFLRFGGAPVYLALNPQTRSPIAALVGKTAAIELAKRIGAGSVKVPVAKKWIARQMKSRNMAVYAIARELHVTDATVRSYLKEEDDRQLSLFG